MRKFFRRLNRRDAVLRDLNALLLFYPRKRQFARDFPALKQRIRADLDAGVSAHVSALKIAQSILENFIRQLDDDAKAKVVASLAAGGRQQYADFAQRHVQGAREDVREHVAFVTRLTGGAIYMAGRMAEEGTLRRGEHDTFVAALETALNAGDDRPLTRAFALSTPG